MAARSRKDSSHRAWRAAASDAAAAAVTELSR